MVSIVLYAIYLCEFVIVNLLNLRTTLILAIVDGGSTPPASTIFEITDAGEWRNWQTHLIVSQAVNRRKPTLEVRILPLQP